MSRYRDAVLAEVCEWCDAQPGERCCTPKGKVTYAHSIRQQRRTGDVRMKVYIAGPMTGLPDFNYPAFFAAARDLTERGHEPINPARAEGRKGCKSWQDYMRAALRDLADADGVAMLPGWHDSRGAVIEFHLAHDLGLVVRRWDEWIA